MEFSLGRIAVEILRLSACGVRMKPYCVWTIGVFGLVAAVASAVGPSTTTEVPYPDGYRRWMQVCSEVIPAKPIGTSKEASDRNAAPHGLILNVYANDLALEGYRSGHFPDGSVLVADWFFLEEKGAALMPATRKSVNVMIRDARFANTGGWGFEDFDRDSHIKRNVGANALTACYACHSHADRDSVFSTLQP